MKIKVMVFISRKKRDEALLRMLEKEKIDVSFTRWIGPFHTALARHEYDAVLVRRGALLSRFIDPVVHLAACRSRHTLIVYGISRDRTKISVRTIRNPDAGFDCGLIEHTDEIRKQKTDMLCAILSQFLLEYYAETEDDIRETSPRYARAGETEKADETKLAIDSEISEMHKKIIAFLTKADARGCANEEIQEYLWKDRTRNRKKDVQSYISTLKKKIRFLYPQKTTARIEYRNGRYFLERNENEEK